MKRLLLLLSVFPGVLEASIVSAAVQDALTFPSSAPADQGLDPEALEILAEEVERLVAADSIVGAELHVIQNRHTVLHRGFGFADREEGRPLEVDSIFCVRSMTKPLVGTAVQMLLDEGRLTLDTKVAGILPAFEAPATADITVEHLLTHTAGFPFSTISGPLSGYATIGDVAAEAARTQLLFRPGTAFQYSDAGADTLGAIVEAISGQPVAGFVQERILEPLGMRDSLTLLEPGSPMLDRIPSAYSGSTGAWMSHWKPSDDPIFSLFLTSQSLYSTTSDYARFLALWMDGGRELLSSAAIERGLTPRNPLPSLCGFEEMRMFYGQQWILYANPAETGKPAVFGHNGSDGTYAWAWPERDLMVFLFTQTRGTLAGVEFESVLDRVLLRGDVEGHRARLQARTAAATGFAPYEGLYWDETNRRSYYVVRAEGERLVMERPGSFVRSLQLTETPGHFVLEGEGITLRFEAPEGGVSEAFLFPNPTGPERQVRHRPAASRPTLDSIVAGLRGAHGLDVQEEVGMVRMTGRIAFKTRGLSGHLQLVFDGRRSRMVASVGGSTEVVWITGGDRVFQQVNHGEITEVEGLLAEQVVLSHPLRSLGDWRDDYREVEVLRRVQGANASAVLVRTVSPEGVGSTKLVEVESGLLRGEDRFEVLPGIGRIGLRVDYGDFRDVAGLTLPFRMNLKYAHGLLGEVVITFETVETGVKAESSLQLPAGR